MTKWTSTPMPALGWLLGLWRLMVLIIGDVRANGELIVRSANAHMPMQVISARSERIV